MDDTVPYRVAAEAKARRHDLICLGHAENQTGSGDLWVDLSNPRGDACRDGGCVGRPFWGDGTHTFNPVHGTSVFNVGGYMNISIGADSRCAVRTSAGIVGLPERQVAGANYVDEFLKLDQSLEQLMINE